MTSPLYDLVIVGAGIAGSSLATVMARAGCRVLLVEQQAEFKDRIRGEGLMPWGVADAGALGVLATLTAAGGQMVNFWNTYAGADLESQRPVVETTPQRVGVFCCYHPLMQDALFAAAAAAGAHTVRPGSVVGLTPGKEPGVKLSDNREVRARLVVLCDGRRSGLRHAAGFIVRHDSHSMRMAGVLVDGLKVEPTCVHMHHNALRGEMLYAFPQGGGRARIYFVHWPDADRRLDGDAGFARLAADARWAGATADALRDARAAGPFASFETADHWVEHPFQNGVVLIGDAAASNDPAFGQGMALAFRDVKTLSDALRNTNDWSSAADHYAAEHDRYYGIVHMVTGWARELFHNPSEAGLRRRQHALPLLTQDPTRMPDVINCGPEFPLAANARERFFGEDIDAASHPGFAAGASRP